MRLILVTGGARGGKSRYAEALARELGGDEVTYVATALPADEEMRARIAHHRSTRPPAWTTVEAPSFAGRAVAGAATEVVLLDCLTLLAANALDQRKPVGSSAVADAMLERVDELLAAAERRPGTLILVTNEIGFGVHPATALGRWFQDGLGQVNQRVAARADQVVLLVSGLPLVLKPRTPTP